MTPEREAQMREAFEQEMRKSFSAFPLAIRTQTFEERQQGHIEYQSAGTQHMWQGFLACARALEPMVGNGELYQWLRSQYLGADFDWQGQCALVFKIPQKTRVSADCDATIKAAMSAALEDGKNEANG